MSIYNLQSEGVNKVEANLIDIQIGKKIRQWRLMRGLTQAQLGEKVGVTFQQIQKYENGINRVLVSRLYDLAVALSIDVSHFFSDIPNNTTKLTSLHESENKEGFDYNYGKGDAESKEILGLVREYRKIKSKKSRSAVYSLIKSLSFSQD